MMWTWVQVSGTLLDPTGKELAQGYSGAGAGKNNPYMQDQADVGPIPAGDYLIATPEDSPKHGPFAMPLVPGPNNEMYARSEFLIHGDSLEHPGCASEGCIILARPVREAIWASGNHQLQVISGLPDANLDEE
jgi:hypothetical protein